MNSVERKRLKRFIAFLKKVPESQFNMNVICQVKNIYDTPDFSCGTAACAIGHLPLFNPRVFSYKYHSGRCYNVLNKETGEYNYIHVGKEYFGLTYSQSEEAFNAYCYPQDKISPSDVAAKLESYL